MLATTASPWRLARRISDRWPSCKLPIVGTNATRPACSSRSRNASADWITSMRCAPLRARRARRSRRPEVEEFALPTHPGDAREQKVDVRRLVDEIETLAVDDQKRRVGVLIEIARVRVGEPRQVLRRNRLLERDAAPMHALDERVDRRLQIDDEVGRRRLRPQM